MTAANHLDREILQTLQEVLDDEFPLLISTFLTDSEERIHGMQKALAAQDSEALRRATHSFKGSCHNLGAVHLADLCQEIETRAKQDELNGLEQQLVEIQQEFAQLKNILRSFVG